MTVEQLSIQGNCSYKHLDLLNASETLFKLMFKRPSGSGVSLHGEILFASAKQRQIRFSSLCLPQFSLKYSMGVHCSFDPGENTMVIPFAICCNALQISSFEPLAAFLSSENMRQFAYHMHVCFR